MKGGSFSQRRREGGRRASAGYAYGVEDHSPVDEDRGEGLENKVHCQREKKRSDREGRIFGGQARNEGVEIGHPKKCYCRGPLRGGHTKGFSRVLTSPPLPEPDRPKGALTSDA